MKRGKKYQEALKKVDKTRTYSLQEAAELVKSCAFANFNETVELSVALSLKKSQSVRDTVVLPNQFMAQKRILVFARATRLRRQRLLVLLMLATQILSIRSRAAGWISISLLQLRI